MHDTELLLYIYKTAKMGIIGLEDVQKHIKNPELRAAVEAQIREYDKIAEGSTARLREIGEKPEEPGMMAHISSEMTTEWKTLLDPTDAKIAEMVIQGNTMGVSKTIRHLHDYTGEDKTIRTLMEQLLATEQDNIEKMKRFL